VSRDQVAAEIGIGRTLAAYRLDRLAAEGLLTVAFERRSGPGAGRPSKVYARAEREIAVSVPPRKYHLAARLLADAAADGTDGHNRRALTAAAERLGREIAAAGPAAELAPLLQERGYEPVHDRNGVVRLRNCPLHAVAQRHPRDRLRDGSGAARRAGRRPRPSWAQRHARARPRPLLRRAQAAAAGER
jgi:predicted ArsR family transcriptional regulator